ncbi:MAG: hypothetical protein NVSMB25_14680 [Thermoleophilaceae bacterium]
MGKDILNRLRKVLGHVHALHMRAALQVVARIPAATALSIGLTGPTCMGRPKIPAARSGQGHGASKRWSEGV